MKDHGPADGEDPLREVGKRQREAADPSASVWVSANAGSGKTRVLVDRVARLLLAGAAPQKILCLTYTRAAAAEMQDRLFKTLGEWALADEPKLRAILAGLDEAKADLGKARRLFALALETPGGLRLQTIHAFCESVLRRFPAETGLSPRFAVLDEADHAEMRRVAAEAAVVELESSADPEDQAAARRVLAEAELISTGDFGRSATLEALAKAAFGHRAAFEAEASPGAGARQALALAPGVSTESLWTAFEQGLDRALLAAAAAHMLTHKKALKTDLKYGGSLKAALAKGGQDLHAALRDFLLLKGGAPRPDLMTKGPREAAPDLDRRLTALQEAMLALEEDLRLCEAADRAADVARFARKLFGFYDAARATRSALDFDDLIARTAALFDESPARAWALFKLDQGVDHILVDEAQDTSPPQWRVVDSLAEEFFAGAGARAPKRTIFAVGDEKQSIYSFQGADPRKFAEQRERFARLTREAPKPLKAIPLTHSFRSSPAILDLVDKVFASEEARKGLTTEGRVKHEAAFPDLAGRVEWWSACVKKKTEDKEPLWHEPNAPAVADVEDSGPPDALLAKALAERLNLWIRQKEPLAPGERPIRPGDVLVLVRNRGQFSRRLIAEMKRLGLPVAGEDRIGLKAALSTRDLLAAARTALLPADSLSLAAVLRSPLFGFKEEDLIRLTDPASENKPLRPGEPRPSLWAALTRRRDEEPHWREAHRLLGDLMTRVDFLRPYEFFERILVEQDARRRLIGRLGPPASEPIDEFLAQALAYETGRAPTLQGFVRWMDGLDAEIKRDSAQAADEIRVMTVHGAKGLEAELVVVADPCKPADDHREPRLVRTPAAEGEGAGGVFWLGSKDKGEASEVAAAREARLERLREEHRRLLYVALTRARTCLVVCGWSGGISKDDAEAKAAESKFGVIGGEGSWHRAVWRAMADWERSGLARLLPPEPEEAKESPMRRFVLERGGRPKTEKAALSAAESSAESSAARAVRTGSLPPAVWPVDWDQAPLAAEPAPLAPLAPSRLAIEAADPARPDSADGPLEPEPKPYEGSGRSRKEAVARGLALHRILERLASPATAPPPGPDETPDLFALAERLVAHPDLAEVFHPGAAAQVLSETPVFGPIPALGGRRIAGSIDRLIVTPDRVLIVDFKTGAPPPEAKISRGYLTQMAAYAAAMSEIFPGRRLRAALLWIDGPRLDRLPAEEMRAALERLRERLRHGPFEPDSEPLAAFDEDFGEEFDEASGAA